MMNPAPLAIPMLALFLLGGCVASAPTGRPAAPGAMHAAKAGGAPVIAAVTGNGQAAESFAAWLDTPLVLAVKATGPKGARLTYRWTTTGAFEGPTDGAAVRFRAREWGHFTATVEVAEPAGKAASRTVRIAVWPGGEAVVTE